MLVFNSVSGSIIYWLTYFMPLHGTGLGQAWVVTDLQLGLQSPDSPVVL